MTDLPLRDPFLRPDSASYADMLTDTAVDLLREHGVTRLTVSALARRMQMTPQAVLNGYSRARVIELLCIGFGRRWAAWSGPDRRNDLPARLPCTLDELHGVRVHHALSEIVRGEYLEGRPDPLAKMVWSRQEERWSLRNALEDASGRPVSELELELTQAVVAGLRQGLAAAEPTLTWQTAADLLRDHVSRLVVDNQPGGQA